MLRHPVLCGGIFLLHRVVPGLTCQDASRMNAGKPTWAEEYQRDTVR